MSATSLFYVYAVAHNSTGLAKGLNAVAGVVGAPVRLVAPSPAAELVAVASPVPEDDFREAALHTHLEDIEWLEALARAHHGVIEALTARTTVLPLRLATVYLDEDRVRSMLHDRYALFLRRLQDLDGTVELGIKLYVDLASAVPPPATTFPDPALGPGRAYLRRRRREQHSRNDAHHAAAQAAERIAESARTHAVGHARHRIQNGELATGPGENVSNDAYLVPVGHAQAFRDEAIHCTDGLTGVRVDVTGPWAPYSFAVPADSDGPS
ncbi:GvpL/GvpF family gas vesicle protein [Kitasatospora purpeofusca]|uniref:GvpL/GvpF family gas vesicle protein n=1 Tax=Kitasatospora purpeofusca TaxID=67352 RepID=UPI0035D7333E